MKSLVFIVPFVLFWLFSSLFSGPSRQVVSNVSDKVGDGLDTLKEIKTTQLENALSKLITVGIVGIPAVIESTDSRTLRYLQDNNHNVTLALEKAESRMSTPLNKIKRIALSNIPYLGLPYSLIDPYWQKIRYLLLVAKLNGYDVSSKPVKEDVMFCLSNSVMSSLERKVENKIFGTILSYVDKMMGWKFFSKVASIPMSVLNIFLEKNNEIIECGKVKFGGNMKKEL